MSPTSNANGSDGQRYGDMRDYMGPSLFQPHRARQAIRDAHEKRIPPMIGYYAGLASVPITRWVAPMGFDYVWIDWEHSAMNVETMTTVRPLLTLPRTAPRENFTRLNLPSHADGPRSGFPKRWPHHSMGSVSTA